MSCATWSADRRVLASVVPLVPAWRVDRTFDYLVPEALAGQIAVGSLVRVRFGGRRVRAVVVALGERVPERALDEIAAVVLPEPVAPPPHHQLLDWVARRYVTPRGVVFARAVPARVRAGRIEIAEPAPPRPAGALAALAGGDDLAGALARRAAGVFLLRPPAGTARGELIAALVGAAGGQAIVTVPEVRYGSVVLDELARAYPGLARLDSALAPAPRAAGWRALAAGHALGAGGRAALLAPAPHLRLLVVDEEHHVSYHEDHWPRYHAPRVALERARLQRALCVFVSSSPSLWASAPALDGRWGYVRPPRAAERALRPLVETVPVPYDRTISHTLHRRIAAALAAGGRVALLAPRRGYARALWCADCHRSVRCPVCEAGLFYERAARRVRCARCCLRAPAPPACPSCGGVELRYVGAGSERLAEQLAAAFPRAAVVRADPETLERGLPERRAVDIYLTTWVGTKPALRPDVSLVGVLDADALIRRPDFRAAEHAYQALAAMAEWAGPAAAGGRLVIQTNEPGHHAVQAVMRADHDHFVRRELEIRAELGYPPFSELVRAGARGAGAKEVIGHAADVARAAGGRVLGPIAAGDELQVLVKCPDATAVAEALRPLVAGAPAGTILRVDSDPR